MPKPQKYRDVVRVLRANGWVLLRRGKGDHEVWGMPQTSGAGQKHTIPHHGEVSAGVIGDLMKKLATTPENWR